MNNRFFQSNKAFLAVIFLLAMLKNAERALAQHSERNVSSPEKIGILTVTFAFIGLSFAIAIACACCRKKDAADEENLIESAPRPH